jgi:hypothetical protein
MTDVSEQALREAERRIATERTLQRRARLIAENIQRTAPGEPPQNLIAPSG